MISYGRCGTFSSPAVLANSTLVVIIKNYDLFRSLMFLVFIFDKVLISVEDTNDNIPMFEESSLRAATKENTAVNSFIHRVTAVDRDRGQ